MKSATPSTNGRVYQQSAASRKVAAQYAVTLALVLGLGACASRTGSVITTPGDLLTAFAGLAAVFGL